MITRWILVGGCGRSGTTMLGNALGAAKDAIVTPEAQFASDLFKNLDSGRLQPSVSEIADFLRGHWRFRTWHEPFPQNLPDCSHCENGFQVGSLILKHLIHDYAVRHSQADATIWIDHTPSHIAELPYLLKSDFELSAVHIVRDGRGVAASIANLDWHPSDIISLAEWWLLRVSEALAAQELIPEKKYMLRYEDFLDDPEAQLRRICDRVALPYTPDMLGSDALLHALGPMHAAVGGPIDRNKADSWKKRLTSREQEIFESITGNFLRALGYDLLYQKPKKPSSMERIWLGYIKGTVIKCIRKYKRRKRKHQVIEGRRFPQRQ